MFGLLNISEAMSIALHTCACLASSDKPYSSTRLIANRLGFSSHHSAKVVQQLVHAGLLETNRGPSGGIRLARSPEKITLFEIYVAAGGQPTVTGCLLKRDICAGNDCMLGKLISKENAKLINLLKRTSLSNIVDSVSQTLRNKMGDKVPSVTAKQRGTKSKTQ